MISRSLPQRSSKSSIIFEPVSLTWESLLMQAQNLANIVRRRDFPAELGSNTNDALDELRVTLRGHSFGVIRNILRAEPHVSALDDDEREHARLSERSDCPPCGHGIDGIRRKNVDAMIDFIQCGRRPGASRSPEQ